MKANIAIIAVLCLGIGWFVGRHTASPRSNVGPSTSADRPPATTLLTKQPKAPKQKPLSEDIPQAKSARDLLKTVESANHARSQAKMYLAVERLTKEELATMAREADVLVRQDWRAWNVQSAIISRWTEIAPREALAYATSLKGSNRSGAIGAVFGQLAVSDPRLAERELASISSSTVRKHALRSLANGLADKDPRQAMATMERHGAPANDYTYNEIASKWARRDPNNAASFASALPPGPKRDSLMNGVARTWASTDPDAALSWARGLGDQRMRRDSVANVISTIATDEPEQALALVKDEPRLNQLSLRQRALSVWFESDHEAAMEWINDRPKQTERLRLFYGSAHSLVWEDPEGAYEIVKDLPAGQDKTRFLSRILSYRSWNDPEGGLEWLKTLPKQTQGRLLGESSVWGFAEADPEGLRELLSGVSITDDNKRAFETLGYEYAQDDPQKALDWAMSIDSDSARTDILASLYGNWATREPETAAEGALAMKDDTQRRRAVANIASSWARNDPEQALEWAEGLSGKNRDEALSSVIKSTASEDPIKASEEVERLFDDSSGGNQMAEAASTVASQWTESDPQAAAEWANQLGQDKARKDAVAAVAQRWSKFDPMGASEWIGELPQGPARDAAANQLSQNIRATDPESAFVWASTIQDEQDRYQALEATVQSWKQSNEAAAREAITSANLSETDQGKLLEKLGDSVSSPAASILPPDPFGP